MKDLWKSYAAFRVKFWNWMAHSGTIAWNRFLVFANAVLLILVTTDISGLPMFSKHPEWLIYWNVISGIIGELIRRRGTYTETTTQYVPDVGRQMEITKLIDVNRGPPPEPKG